MTDTNHPLTTDQVRNMVLEELMHSGWTIKDGIYLPPSVSEKWEIREVHKTQRLVRSSQIHSIVKRKRKKLLQEFAEGREIDPSKFEPVLIPVDSSTITCDLFRFATLFWSVPVSRGFGRRMRYLVRDAYNGKLVGIFGLMDPVFNLGARDALVNWNYHQREERLYHVMDSYVLGAVPPYNDLLAGKMIALSVVSNQVRNDFYKKYYGHKTIINKVLKDPSLVLVTTTSALGRSSIYNRIQLPDEPKRVFQSIGFSGGWGHFHISDNTFNALRDWLRSQGSTYADLHQFGDGPNWRFRTIRQALKLLGFGGDSLRHGIKREVFAAPLACNFKEFLRGEEVTPQYYDRDLSNLAAFFRERWMVPRSQRIQTWRNWTRDMTWARIAENLESTFVETLQPTLF